MIDTAEIQFDAIRAYLAQVPPNRALPASARRSCAMPDRTSTRAASSRAGHSITPVIARQAEAAGRSSAWH
jgi:hypothetical protein